MGGFSAMLNPGTYSGGGSGPFGLQPQPIKGNDLTQTQRATTNLLGTGGASSFGAGAQGVGNTMDFWSNILSNNPSAIMQFLQPVIGQTQAQFQAARQNVDQFSPRGGGRAEVMNELPFQQASTISNILAQARPQAASALGPLALGEQQTGLNALQSAIQAILQKMGINTQEDIANRGLLTGGLQSVLGGVSQGLQPFLNAAAGLPH